MSKHVSYQVPKRLCPKCGYELDGVSPLEGDAKPKTGDVSICLKCAAVLCFAGGDNLVPEERAEVLRDPEIMKIQAAAREIMERVKTGWRPLVCPCCEMTLPDEVRTVAGVEPGMVVICAYCANAITMMKDGRFVLETDEEFLKSEGVVLARKVVQVSIDRRKANAN